MRENVGNCPFENERSYPMTYSFLKKLFLGAQTPPKWIKFGTLLGKFPDFIKVGAKLGKSWEEIGEITGGQNEKKELQRKMGNESMGENEEFCLFENERIYPITYSFLLKLFLGA